uniref:Uncharacterized protein n=1 Tax=Pavo cristatus TaxID=9049 RepID=A0A8C9FQ11_PAVCR
MPESRPGRHRTMAATAAEQEQQQFYLLLGNLLSPDNAVRKQAEVTVPPQTCLEPCWNLLDPPRLRALPVWVLKASKKGEMAQGP